MDVPGTSSVSLSFKMPRLHLAGFGRSCSTSASTSASSWGGRLVGGGVVCCGCREKGFQRAMDCCSSPWRQTARGEGRRRWWLARKAVEVHGSGWDAGGRQIRCCGAAEQGGQGREGRATGALVVGGCMSSSCTRRGACGRLEWSGGVGRGSSRCCLIALQANSMVRAMFVFSRPTHQAWSARRTAQTRTL